MFETIVLNEIFCIFAKENPDNANCQDVLNQILPLSRKGSID